MEPPGRPAIPPVCRPNIRQDVCDARRDAAKANGEASPIDVVPEIRRCGGRNDNARYGGAVPPGRTAALRNGLNRIFGLICYAAGAIWSSPLVVKGNVIFGDDAHNLYSLNRDDGTPNWRVRLDGKVRVAPTLVNGRLIARTYVGTVYAVR